MSADAPQNVAFKEKAPRGETGLFLRREQLGEARWVNAGDTETFRTNQGADVSVDEATGPSRGPFLKSAI